MNKFVALKPAVVAAGFAVLTGCPSPTNPDINGAGQSTTPAVSSLPEVVLSGGSVSSTSITIAWTEPSDQNYAGVQISYSQTNTVVPAGTSQATLTNSIVDGVETNIEFKSIDMNGKKSAGFSLHITPRPGPIGLHFISTAADLEAIETAGFAAGDYYVLFVPCGGNRSGLTECGRGRRLSDR